MQSYRKNMYHYIMRIILGNQENSKFLGFVHIKICLYLLLTGDNVETDTMTRC